MHSWDPHTHHLHNARILGNSPRAQDFPGKQRGLVLGFRFPDEPSSQVGRQQLDDQLGECE